MEVFDSRFERLITWTLVAGRANLGLGRVGGLVNFFFSFFFYFLFFSFFFFLRGDSLRTRSIISNLVDDYVNIVQHSSVAVVRKVWLVP